MKAATPLVIIAGVAGVMEPGGSGSKHIRVMPAHSLVEVLDTDGTSDDPDHAITGSPQHIFI